MARSQAELDEFKKAFNSKLGRDPEQAAIDAFNNAGISLADRVKEIDNTDEARQYASTGISSAQQQALKARAEADVAPEIAAVKSGVARQQENLAQSSTEEERQATLQAGQEETLAKTGAGRLQEEVAKVYARTREANPYNRVGVRSGAREDFVTDQEATKVMQIGQDLNTQLMFVAQRLNALRTTLTERKNLSMKQGNEDVAQAEVAGANKARSLTATYSDQLLKRRADQQKVDLEAQQAAQKAAKPNTQLTEVNGRRVLINQDTGDIIKDIGSSASPKTGGSGGGGKGGVAKGYSLKQASEKTGGGLSFYDNRGVPVTAYQYLSSKSDVVDAEDIAKLLSRSKDAGDQEVIKAIRSGVSVDELVRKYPWIFGE